MPVTCARKTCVIASLCFLFASFFTASAHGAELEDSFLLETNGSSDPLQKYVTMVRELAPKERASRFAIVDRPDGRVCLKAIDIDSYLSARNDRTSVGLEGHCQNWEAFRMERLGGGFYTFKSHHGTYLRAHFKKNELDQADKIGEWERFKLAKFTNINGFGNSVFIPLAPLHRAERTQSWIYMPMILASLQALGVENERHLPFDSVQADRGRFERDIPEFFKLMTDLMSFKIRRKMDEGVPVTFLDDTLTIGDSSFRFDKTKHMKGDDQERFLNTYSNTSAVDVGAFLFEYQQSEQPTRSLFETASMFDDPDADLPYFVATLNSIITATTF